MNSLLLTMLAPLAVVFALAVGRAAMCLTRDPPKTTLNLHVAARIDRPTLDRSTGGRMQGVVRNRAELN